jgi:hypothetical protein
MRTLPYTCPVFPLKPRNGLTPNFLHVALDTTTCAPFVKERRMNFAIPTKLHRKSGKRATPTFMEGKTAG